MRTALEIERDSKQALFNLVSSVTDNKMQTYPERINEKRKALEYQMTEFLLDCQQAQRLIDGGEEVENIL